MTTADEDWLVNRIFATFDVDAYMDVGEEKGIKQDAASRGIAVNDIERVLRREIEKHGATRESVLLEELDQLLHQFTHKDKYLDAREEENLRVKVLTPAPGKKYGLDPAAFNKRVAEFCAARGVGRASERQRSKLIIPAAAAALLIALAALYFLLPRERVTSSTVTVDSAAYNLTDQDRAEIDDQLRRAAQYVEQAQYTDPPERSAKASLDRIRQVDPQGKHRGAEVTALIDRIVDQYIALAQKSHAARDREGVKKWLDRARLFNKNSEVIREKEREFGIVQAEK